ncbi:hypothetical protein [Winogradskyella endarachnes]|uniref:DUF3137 domain-containing protein n=1 Tax=Winogradskyella endarachnes TaxID=2681965 RepID=A0A6L6UDM5_9FLAO|nr:hypothetical protein [Winogradskyella endarachnes]MUU78947.1 hypothetical protein [Winogradskyella endarachnes]
MIEQQFQNLAETYNCKWQNETYRVDVESGFGIEISYYTITIPHQESGITIRYEFGNHNLAKIKSSIKTVNAINNFTLTTRSHFSRLLYSKANIWQIKCKNNVLEKTVLNCLKESGLARLAQTEAFEPTIKGIQNNDTYTLTTEFYLGFNNKEQSLFPSLHFHQLMLDNFNRNYDVITEPNIN